MEKEAIQRVGQEQIQDLIFGEKLSWQSIIYDLINTEQLNPWDIDLAILSNKYLEKVKMLEEANFFVSSKVLLAASLLLRLKSEILLNEYVPSLDEILFGKKEDKVYHQERIELEEDIPDLVPRTPLPRLRKVTLEELMSALGKAIKTENRRIQRVVLTKQQEMEVSLSIPKRRINVQDKINEIYSKLTNIFSSREEKLAFSELSGPDAEEKIASFVPLLHLDNQQKVWLEQEGHLEEIWILMKHMYEKQNSAELERMKKEVEDFMANAEKEQEQEEIDAKQIPQEDDDEEDEKEETLKPMAPMDLDSDSNE
jgi:segregation and condensation protein A